MTDAPRSKGYVELVRNNSSFRNLWIGQIVSLLGDWFNLIASATLVAQLTGSGVAVGGLFVVRMLAPFFVSLYAGVASDRYNRKWLLILADILRGVIVIGFFFVRDAQDIWLLYTLTVIQLGISGLFFPVKNAILPDVVEKSELGTANALSSATWSTMLSLGAALGGLVSGGFGIYVAFAVDALTFFVSAFFIWLMKYDPPPRTVDSNSSQRGVFNDFAEGLAYLWKEKDVLAVALHKTAVSLLMFVPYQVIFVDVAEKKFVIGEGGGIGLGIMYGIVGIGTGIGPILIRRFTGDRDRALRSAIAVNYIVAIIGVVLTAPVSNLTVFLFGSFLRAIGTGTIWVFSTQLLLQNVPDKVRGRIMGTEYALFTVAGAAGAAIAGWSLDSFETISASIWLLAGLWIIPTALWFFWLARHRTSSVGVAAENEPLKVAGSDSVG